jgi:hypothetical protein
MALSDQLLNHFKEKFGIVTVVNATFYEVDGTVPKISFDTLKMSNITSEGQQKEIRGGQGAELLLQYDFGRTANIEITDALVSVGSLEYLFGGVQSEGTKIFPRRIEGVIATTNTWPTGSPWPTDRVTAVGDYDDTKALLIRPDGSKSEVPGAAGLPTLTGSTNADVGFAPAGTKFVLYYNATRVVGTNKILSNVFDATPDFVSGYGLLAPADYVSGSDVTVVWTDVSTGDVTTFISNNAWPVVEDLTGVAQNDPYTIYYQSSTNGGTFGFKEMVLKASDFPPIVRFIGETIVLDADTGRKIALQVEIPKMKLNANFTISFDAEGDPSVFDFSGVALSHNGELLKIRTLGQFDEIN